MRKVPTALAIALMSTITLAACSPAADQTTTPETTSTTTSPSATAEPSTPAAASTEGTAITLTAGEVVMTGTLNDTQVAQDFAAMLPVTLPWFRNSGIEYITELPAPLTETGPFYTDVQPGDIVYYNPLDSITIIYEETVSVPTLTEMGEITSDLSVFDDLPDEVDMLVELG
ncbi:cyclophilin-like fold protein [Cellulomonas sp. 179-A 4D5 NHS]|uniref:cyclophilin-like fold protein n=1 Tax=Cellulomonas sp. 179-A 4D5 NHS TaxID=3142378 RepID=UPI0039A151C1